ncbi:HAD-like domain-containing protein [Cladorrhinum sp. PSN332]|nr:HAD-like domain-containing protein [Cladorrhinum sp. PSN332]
MMTTPRLVIINFEGTLFDTREAVIKSVTKTFESVKHNANRLEMTYSEVWSCIYGYDTIEKAFHAMLVKTYPKEASNGAFPPYILHIWATVYRAIYAAVGIQFIKAYPHAYELLKTLNAAKMPTAILASNKPQAFVIDVLKMHRMDHLFERCMVVADTGIRSVPAKPDVSSYKEYGLDLFSTYPGLNASDVLIVGDTEGDIKYGRRIGANVCWVVQGYGHGERCAEYMRAFRPGGSSRGIVVKDLAELEKFIQRLVHVRPSAR